MDRMVAARILSYRIQFYCESVVDNYLAHKAGEAPVWDEHALRQTFSEHICAFVQEVLGECPATNSEALSEPFTALSIDLRESNHSAEYP